MTEMFRVDPAQSELQKLALKRLNLIVGQRTDLGRLNPNVFLKINFNTTKSTGTPPW